MIRVRTGTRDELKITSKRNEITIQTKVITLETVKKLVWLYIKYR